MEFRRIPELPPYVFAVTDKLKLDLRRAGEDVIDLGFGNPDIPSPALAVEKLSEAAHNTRNHRYSASRGIPKLRQALADLYANLTPWQKTLVARHPQRPHFTDFVSALTTEFTPMAGDRKFAEDEALVGGFGRFRRATETPFNLVLEARP